MFTVVGLFLFSPSASTSLPFRKELTVIHIRNISDTIYLNYDQELQREVISYMLYCQYELQEYADEDDPDFNFTVLQKYDLQMMEDMPKILGVKCQHIANGKMCHNIANSLWLCNGEIIGMSVT